MKIRANTVQAANFIKKLGAGFSGRQADSIVERVAYQTMSMLIKKTPKKYTGQTRRSWITQRHGRDWQVTNTSKIMLFLELGTQAHGPVQAKMLFIPLNAHAAIGGWRPGLVYGRDYILRHSVHGIWNGATGVSDPRGMVQAQRKITREMLLAQMRSYVQSLVGK